MFTALGRYLTGLCLCLLACGLAAGCGPKSQFLLLPDPDGRVGALTVSNEKGSQLLDKAYMGASVDSADKAPSPPTVWSQDKITKLFGPALEAQPDPAVTFILYFISGTSDLTEESIEKIPRIMAAIRDRKSTDLSVIGHTDRVGAAEMNRRLSVNRASRVAEILISKGADSNSIEVTSHGEENPLIPTADDVAEPKNRRVEVTVR